MSIFVLACSLTSAEVYGMSPESNEPLVPSDDVTPDKPRDGSIATFGPFPSGEKSFLSVKIWKKEVEKDGKKTKVFFVRLMKKFFNKEGKFVTTKKSKMLRSFELPLALILLEKARQFIESQK